jgi:rhodanese-related sulfurtransferase
MILKKLGLLTAILFGLLVMISGCQSQPTYENVSSEKAKELIDEQKVEVVDVRTEEEYNQGHIPGAKLIPLDQLDNHIDELEKEQSYLIVCRSGNRSTQASEQLVDNGFTNILNLKKGMNEWTYDVE